MVGSIRSVRQYIHTSLQASHTRMDLYTTTVSFGPQLTGIRGGLSAGGGTRVAGDAVVPGHPGVAAACVVGDIRRL